MHHKKIPKTKLALFWSGAVLAIALGFFGVHSLVAVPNKSLQGAGATSQSDDTGSLSVVSASPGQLSLNSNPDKADSNDVGSSSSSAATTTPVSTSTTTSHSSSASTGSSHLAEDLNTINSLSTQTTPMPDFDYGRSSPSVSAAPTYSSSACSNITPFGSAKKMYQCSYGSYPPGSCKDITPFGSTKKLYECM